MGKFISPTPHVWNDTNGTNLAVSSSLNLSATTEHFLWSNHSTNQTDYAEIGHARMLYYFTITGVFGGLALVVLLVYCFLSYLEKLKAFQEANFSRSTRSLICGRQRRRTPTTQAGSGNDSSAASAAGKSRAKKYLVPFVMYEVSLSAANRN